MQKILARRAGRNFIKNCPRYLALMGLIFFSFFTVICTAASAETIITGTWQLAQEDKAEDGQFATFVPLSAREERRLEGKGITLEKMFSTDYLALEQTTLRIFKNRSEINLLRPVSGRVPIYNNEIALERRYSESNNLQTNDTITVAGKPFTVCGIVTTPDYEGPFKFIGDSIIDSKTFGTGFVTASAYELLQSTGKGLQAEEYLYAYRLNDSISHKKLKEALQDFSFNANMAEDEYFKQYWNRIWGRKDQMTNELNGFSRGLHELSCGMEELAEAAQKIPAGLPGAEIFSAGVRDAQKGSEKLEAGFSEFRVDADEALDKIFDGSHLSNLKSFVKAEENPRIGCAGDDAKINQSSAPLAGIIVMILFAYVAAVFVTHEIERDNCVIGTLYALGVTRKDLLFHYLQLPVLTTFFASLISFCAGTSNRAISWMNVESALYFSVPDLNCIIPHWLIIYALAVPSLIAIFVNWAVISKKLNRPALSMIRNENKKRHVSKLQLKHFNFVSRFRIRQLLREFRSAFAVVLGIFIAYLLLSMGINCHMLCSGISQHNQKDISFHYLYTYKYPDSQVPAGGTPVCGKTLKIESMGYKMDVTLLGIAEDNPYFELNLAANESDVTISDSIATKFHLKKDDTFLLEDTESERFYAFRVREIIPYSPSFMVFMDIDQARDLLGADGNYFNIVLAGKDLHIPTGKLYSTVNSADIISASDIFMDLMRPMISLLGGGAVLVLIIVMFLMMRVMVDRSAQSIALFRIFGYRSSEIRKLYLDGNFLVVAVGSAAALPLAKLIMDNLYPYFISNVACAVFLSYPWYYYILIWGATLAIYLIINAVLMVHIRRITPADSLANRE